MRATIGRRRGDRRRQRLRTVLLVAATTFLTHHVKTAVMPSLATTTEEPGTEPHVAVSINAFRLPPHLAYEDIIQDAAARYRLDPALIRAVMRIESAFDPMVVSRVGAQGLMQLMPDLAEEMGVRDAFDPRDNIMGGARYLRQLLTRHHGDVRLALASYNAGPGAVDRYKRVPPFRETQRYVKLITGLLARDRSESGAN